MSNRVSAIISDQSLNRGMQIESAGKPNAKASTSTATGLFQFLNQSWFDVLYKHGPLNIAKRIKYNPANKKKPYTVPDGSERTILDMRKAAGNPALLKLNIDMGARLWEDNAKVIGKGFNDGDLYLAHFLGVGSAKKCFRADQNATAVSVCGQAAADANLSIFYSIVNGKRGRAKTVAELRAWAINSMKSRWAKAGEPDWVGKYYPKEAHVDEPEPAPEETHDEKPPVKMDIHERDEDADAAKDESDNTADVPEPRVDTPAEPDPPVPAQKEAAPVKLPAGVTIKGDPDTWFIQFRLQRMHYGPSMLDGRYGGKTSAAIAAFLNDWPEEGSHLTPPKSNEEFFAIRDELKGELTNAEAQGWVRPVTEARKEAKPEVVKEVAPEAAPIQRNKTVGIWGAIVTAVTGAIQYAGDAIAGAWDFFIGHKDDIPDEVKDPSTLSWIWNHVTALPPLVWFGLAFAAFAFFAFNSSSGLKTIIDKVKTGER
jgi:hypothetical protein